MSYRENLDPKFADYVTRVAFDLNLSRGQITAIAIVKMEQDRDDKRRKSKKDVRFTDPNRQYGPRFSHFVPAVRGLINRGLVTWEDPVEMKPRWDHYPYRLTRAGNLVFQLLELAGLVRDASDYYSKKAA